MPEPGDAERPGIDTVDPDNPLDELILPSCVEDAEIEDDSDYLPDVSYFAPLGKATASDPDPDYLTPGSPS